MPRGRNETYQYRERPVLERRGSFLEEEFRGELEATEMQKHPLQKRSPSATMRKLCDFVAQTSQNLIGQLSRQGNILLETLSDSEQRKKRLFQILWGRKGIYQYEQNKAKTANALLNARGDFGNFNL